MNGAWEKDFNTGAKSFIQWKGTDVCMDWWCSCGNSNHVDSDFLYSVQCKHCGKVWEVGTQVALRPTTEPWLVESAKQDNTSDFPTQEEKP